MKIKTVVLSLVALMILTACHKAVPASDSGSAQAVQGQIYRSLDGTRSLSLTSADDCEYRDGQTTLVGKYTKQPDALHVVVNVAGADQVKDFHFTSVGIQGSDGPVLLSTLNYSLQALQTRAEKERDDLLK